MRGLRSMPKKMSCIVSDIDNTVVNMDPVFREIFNKKLRGSEAWKYFEDNCDRGGLEVIKPVVHILRYFHKKPDVEIIFVTARSETIRAKTQAFLDFLGFSECPLFMRSTDDAREAAVYKKSTLKEISDFYEISLFLDDEINNREAAKSLGIFSPKPSDWEDYSECLKRAEI